MKKSRQIAQGIQPILLGFMVMAVAYLGVAAGRILELGNKMEFAGVAVVMLGWCFIGLGSFFLKKEKAEFTAVFYFSAASLLSLAVQGGLAVLHHHQNMGDQTFIQFDVMFFGYIGLLCMMGAYRIMMKIMAETTEKSSTAKKTRDWKGIWVVCLVIIFAGTLFLPLAMMFSTAVSYLLTALIALVVFGTEAYLCLFIQRGYQAKLKKR